ncbi:SHOCT domain-containing protein [Alkalicoccus saliphilus]|nr:SHOCT domain-containing protein [Alkalicoccus saliphilus]
MSGMMNGSMMLGMILWIVFVVGVIILTIYVVTKVGKKTQRSNKQDTTNITGSGKQILDERYANGEITEREYRRKKMMIEEMDSK